MTAVNEDMAHRKASTFYALAQEAFHLQYFEG